ncbi:hypothetical protein EON62_02085 [archaeon]|nr:MAG: hypothetical protein EON62_02085 [archaeon]
MTVRVDDAQLRQAVKVNAPRLQRLAPKAGVAAYDAGSMPAVAAGNTAMPIAAHSDPAAKEAAYRVSVPKDAFAEPYRSTIMDLTPDMRERLLSSHTDVEDPRFFAAYIEKRGDGAMASYKKRWVVLKWGFLMYFNSEEDHKKVRARARAHAYMPAR